MACVHFPLFILLFAPYKQLVFPKESDLFVSIHVAKPSEPSKSWTALCHKEPQSPSLLSLQTTRATQPRGWLPLLPTYLVKIQFHYPSFFLIHTFLPKWMSRWVIQNRIFLRCSGRCRGGARCQTLWWTNPSDWTPSLHPPLPFGQVIE